MRGFVHPWMRRRRVRCESISPSSGMRRGSFDRVHPVWRGRSGLRRRNELRCADGRRCWIHGRLRCALKKWRCRGRLGRSNGFFRFLFRRHNLFACRFRGGIDFGFHVLVGIFGFFSTPEYTEGQDHEALLQNRPTFGRSGHRQRGGRQCGRCFRLAFLHVPTLATKSPNHAGAVQRYQAFSRLSMMS